MWRGFLDTISSGIIRQDSLIQSRPRLVDVFVGKVSEDTRVITGIQLGQGFSTENLKVDASLRNYEVLEE